jgi:hypothetical protein
MTVLVFWNFNIVWSLVLAAWNFPRCFSTINQLIAIEHSLTLQAL